MSEFICNGILNIQEGIVANNSNIKIKSNNSSYQISVPCTSFATAIDKSELYTVNLQIKTEQNLKRITGKNLYKDIKNSVCLFSNKSESSKVRKRLIAIQKIYGNISNQDFVFSSCQIPAYTAKKRYLTTASGQFLETTSEDRIIVSSL